VSVPVLANGEIWTLDDYWRCRSVSGQASVMLGRGLVSRPDLALQIAAAVRGEETVPQSWTEILPRVQRFWSMAQRKLAPRYAPGRLKQWLGMLTRSYPEAAALFAQVRRESDCALIDHLLGMAGQNPANLDLDQGRRLQLG
jgi:tRNA-dihydrouridine synthase C